MANHGQAGIILALSIADQSQATPAALLENAAA